MLRSEEGDSLHVSKNIGTLHLFQELGKVYLEGFRVADQENRPVGELLPGCDVWENVGKRSEEHGLIFHRELPDHQPLDEHATRGQALSCVLVELLGVDIDDAGGENLGWLEKNYVVDLFGSENEGSSVLDVSSHLGVRQYVVIGPKIRGCQECIRR